LTPRSPELLLKIHKIIRDIIQILNYEIKNTLWYNKHFVNTVFDSYLLDLLEATDFSDPLSLSFELMLNPILEKKIYSIICIGM
jgi:hypothetical protein